MNHLWKKYTALEDRILRKCLAQSRKQEFMAKLLDRSVESVRHRLRRLRDMPTPEPVKPTGPIKNFGAGPIAYMRGKEAMAAEKKHYDGLRYGP